MCSTPKRTGILFHSARLEEDTASSDYTAMLRRASRRMDKVQEKRERQSAPEPAKKSGAAPGPETHRVRSKPEPSFLSRCWNYLNTPHYLFR